jgi:NAD(P)-dependent dehydrogenase (short-subunit alcohol dehydrogenase family)
MTKTIFITGTSSGLGKATAKLFAKHGWNVIASMRNPEKEKELTGFKNIRLEALDVTNAEQIKQVVETVTAQTNINIVFNNAGYGLAGPFEGADDEQIVQQLNTNLLGVIRVTKAFLPHFRKNKGGTFITTTSIGGLLALPFNSVYHAAKWGLEGWSESLAFELKPFDIKVKTVSPGGIITDFAGRSLVMTQHPAYDDQMKQLLSVFMDPERAKNYSTAEQIAEYVWEAATDNSEKLRYIAGEDAKAMYKRRLEVGSEQASKEIENLFYGK